MMTTKNLRLILQSAADVGAYVDAMTDSEREEVPGEWIDLSDGTVKADPWVHGFVIMLGITGLVVGRCGFKGPPSPEGMVEIAYALEPDFQGKGYATEAAAALTQYAFEDSRVKVVRAHTLDPAGASARVLTKCGFSKIGEFMDPDDGLVWRWERRRE